MSSLSMSTPGSFAEAHDFIINRSVFNEAQGNIHNVTHNINNVQSNTGWDPLKLLFDTAAPGALHNSEESFPRTGCHPDTRATALREIKDWREGDHRVLWLYGAAGIGKSAIAQTVAGQCTEEGRPVATFFFRRGDDKRSHGKHFCATLAAQIYNIPEIRQSLRQAIVDDPLIFGRSLDTQFKKLFVEPLQKLAPGAANVVVIIDGLDECEEARTQNEILCSIENSLRSPPSLPVYFLITSRPEPGIKRAFEHVNLGQFANRILLDHSDESDRDIRAYLRTGFADIRKNHGTLPESWPTDGILDLLVIRSSGQFIYAATVLKFVGDKDFLPTERLETVTDASDSQALRTLDDLYRQILSTCHTDNIDCLHNILAMVLVVRYPSCELIDYLLEIKAGKSRLVLQRFHSLLSIPTDDEDSITIPHKSLSDFLQDPSRSGRFFVDVAVYHAWPAKRCMQLIVKRQEDILLRRLEDIERRQCDYAMRNWSYHVSRSHQGDADLMDTLQQFEHDVYLFDITQPDYRGDDDRLEELLAWLKKVSCIQFDAGRYRNRLPSHLKQPGYHNWLSSSLSRCSSKKHGLQRYFNPIRRLLPSSVANKPTQPGCTCTDRLAESFQSRKSNIARNFISQWSIASLSLEPRGSSDRYVRGDLDTVAERDRWRRAAVLHVLVAPEDFGVGTIPAGIRSIYFYDATKIAQALDDDIGNVVRHFSDQHFGHRPEQDHIEHSRAILSILHKLNLVEDLTLSSMSIHPALVEEFARAFRQMRTLHAVDLQSTMNGPKFRDICLCVGSWPHLTELEMSGFEEGQWLVSDHEASKPECLLKHLSLEDGRILGPQLRFLTVSSHSSLSNVELYRITGLSNTDLRGWLSEVGPSLRRLSLGYSLFPRERHDEEHAIDATIHMMCKLRYVWLGGDVVSALAIERKTRNQDGKGSRIDIDNAPALDGLGLTRALLFTGFARISIDNKVILWEREWQSDEGSASSEIE